MLRYVSCVILVITGLLMLAPSDLSESDTSGPGGVPVVQICLESGITPDAVACAGVSASAAAVMMADAIMNSQLADQVESTRTQLAALSSEVAYLANQLMIDASNEELRSAYEAKLSQLLAQRAEIAELEAAFVDQVTEDLSPAAKETLETVIANRCRRVPSEFKVLSMADDEWVALEVAIRAEEWSQFSGALLDATQSSLLAAIRANPSVATAATQLAQSLAAIEVTFAQAEGE
jgi:hypothetical protein